MALSSADQGKEFKNDLHSETKTIILAGSTGALGQSIAAYLLQKHAGIRKEQITLWALMHRPRHFTPSSELFANAAPVIALAWLKILTHGIEHRHVTAVTELGDIPRL